MKSVLKWNNVLFIQIEEKQQNEAEKSMKVFHVEEIADEILDLQMFIWNFNHLLLVAISLILATFLTLLVFTMWRLYFPG